MVNNIHSYAPLDVSFTLYNKEINIQGFSEKDWIYKTINRTKNFYELDLLQYIKYVLREKKGGMLDIGANIGNHSVFFGSYISNKIICFEPNPKVSPILKRNLLINRINNKLYELGLGDKEGYAEIKIPDGHENNVGAARLMTANMTPAAIHVVTLDSLLPKIKEYLEKDSLLAIKMDVEGMEPNVLNGGRSTINFYKPEIFVEVSDVNQMQRINPILVEMGYKKIVSYAATPVWHYSHKSKLTLINILRIKSYIFLDKLSRKIKLNLSRVIRFFNK